ncbi:hypothetical protein [Bradyrhizobium centrolobii]|uniref:hypothetical protein n=1 Tax=Bradyrhizobium centrolobii TaxID=1505087 RepID=UPI00191BA54C|nr:hypothetical protein [Bradyrhizobium centrolobii]
MAHCNSTPPQNNAHGLDAENAPAESTIATVSLIPETAAKARLCRHIATQAAAVRRHAVCGAGARGNITNQINSITEHDAIVTWLDLIMSGQYGPRGF